GGETVFFGDLGKNCRNLINYFEGIPGVAPLPKHYNPATWMLECIGAGVGNVSNDDTDFVQVFNGSKNKLVLDEMIAQDGIGRPAPGMPELLFTQKRAASSLTQAWALIKRFLDMYWRTPSYNLTRFVVTTILAVLFAIVFTGAEYTTYQGINAGVGMVYMATLFNGIVSFNSVLPIASEERASFYRERASQTYNALWYFVGGTIAEIPYTFGSGLLFTVIFYWSVGFTGFGTAVLYWISTSLMVLMSTYMGQFLAFAMPSVEVAAIVGVLMNSIFFNFMGFNPTASVIPEGYKWLYAITPQRYPLAIVAALVFADCSEMPTWDEETRTYSGGGPELGCQPVSNTPVNIDHITVKEYVETVFNMRHDDIGANFGYIFVAILVFRVLALLSLRYLNHQKR
ncbi:Atp-binding protein, partial [Globisporangium polare]